MPQAPHIATSRTTGTCYPHFSPFAKLVFGLVLSDCILEKIVVVDPRQAPCEPCLPIGALQRLRCHRADFSADSNNANTNVETDGDSESQNVSGHESQAEREDGANADEPPQAENEREKTPESDADSNDGRQAQVATDIWICCQGPNDDHLNNPSLSFYPDVCSLCRHPRCGSCRDR
jgi:hypothetical protein